MKMLLKYHFPGNVRELQNIIERAIVLTRGEFITKDELPVSIADTAKSRLPGRLEEAVSTIEKEMILDALNRTKGNQTKAADELGISERVLRYKIKKYKIAPK